MDIKCPHCGQALSVNMNVAWTSHICVGCTKTIDRAFFMARESSATPKRYWDEENARSLRSIAVHLQMIASAQWITLVDGKPTSEQSADLVERTRASKVSAFEEE